ncbi:MAG: dynamin family protein [Gemmatales bacterium]|nr:dynamin family protein [Gemmatales bacterium]MDW8387691.1 dynamin family protein [Gemmatales bacterium]
MAVFGEFNRGKSTLINALVGYEVLPRGLVPTTGQVVTVAYGSKNQVRVRFLNGSEQVCSFKEINSFVCLSQEGIAREDIDEVEVTANSRFLRSGLTLIDTPGLNDRDAQTFRARNAIAKADLVLLILDARTLLTQLERQMSIDWLSRDLGKAVVPIVNFMNCVDESEHDDVRVRLRHWCESHLPKELSRPWFEVNALGALRHVLGLPGSTPPKDDYTELRSQLQKMSTNTRRGLQRRSRFRQLLVSLRETQSWNRRLLAKLREDAARVEQERNALIHDLNEHRRRFEANASISRDRACVLARKVLDKGIHFLVNSAFKGESKTRLEANAQEWYTTILQQAIRRIEKKAYDYLIKLAGDKLRRPSPLTIEERMIIRSRIEVDTLEPISPSGEAYGLGAGIGATIGTFIAPGVGTLLGAGLGAWMTYLIGTKEPDYAAAYSDKAREHWDSDSQTVINILQQQYDARIQELNQEFDQRLAELSRQRPQGEQEMHERINLDITLAKATEYIQSELGC